MIPLGYFIIAWLIFLALYGILSLLSIAQMMRLGIAGAGTYCATIVFLAVIALTVLGAGGYLLTADWTAPVHLFDWIDVSQSSLLPQ